MGYIVADICNFPMMCAGCATNFYKTEAEAYLAVKDILYYQRLTDQIVVWEGEEKDLAHSFSIPPENVNILFQWNKYNLDNNIIKKNSCWELFEKDIY